jgi:hypothetical protein
MLCAARCVLCMPCPHPLTESSLRGPVTTSVATAAGAAEAAPVPSPTKPPLAAAASVAIASAGVVQGPLSSCDGCSTLTSSSDVYMYPCAAAAVPVAGCVAQYMQTCKQGTYNICVAYCVMYTYICVYVYVYVYVCTFMYVYVCACVHLVKVCLDTLRDMNHILHRQRVPVKMSRQR